MTMEPCRHWTWMRFSLCTHKWQFVKQTEKGEKPANNYVHCGTEGNEARENPGHRTPVDLDNDKSEGKEATVALPQSTPDHSPVTPGVPMLWSGHGGENTWTAQFLMNIPHSRIWRFRSRKGYKTQDSQGKCIKWRGSNFSKTCRLANYCYLIGADQHV